MIQDRKPAAPNELACWVVEPYGAPTDESECSRIEGFYRLESLVAFGTGRAGEASSLEISAEADRVAA